MRRKYIKLCYQIQDLKDLHQIQDLKGLQHQKRSLIKSVNLKLSSVNWNSEYGLLNPNFQKRSKP